MHGGGHFGGYHNWGGYGRGYGWRGYGWRPYFRPSYGTSYLRARAGTGPRAGGGPGRCARGGPRRRAGGSSAGGSVNCEAFTSLGGELRLDGPREEISAPRRPPVQMAEPER